MPLIVPTYEQIFQAYLARIVASTDLSDVGDASVLRHLAAATARAVDQGNYQVVCLKQLFGIDTATGQDLDARAAEIAGLTRIPGSAATGFVIFSRQATSGSVSIKAGTSVQDALGNVFNTTTPVAISDVSAPQITGHIPGQDAQPAAIVAALAGTAGNVAANTVVQFVQKPTGVDAVVNLGATSQGSDAESDDAFRARLKNYIASLPRSTEQALATAVLGARDPDTGQQILFSAVQEDPSMPGYVSLYVDDGSGTAESVATVASENVTFGLSGPTVNTAVGGESRLYLDHHPVKPADTFTLTSSTRGTLTRGTDYTLDEPSGLLVFTPTLAPGEQLTAAYTYYTGIVAYAQKIVDGDPNDPTNFPGIRAAGIRVSVLSPQVVAQPIDVVLTIADGYDYSTVQQSVQSAIVNSINQLPISGDIRRATLFAAIMGQQGVLNAIITTPAADVAVSDGQIARVLSSNVTVN